MHDVFGIHFAPFAADSHGAVELRSRGHQLGSGAGMKSKLVDDDNGVAYHSRSDLFPGLQVRQFGMAYLHIAAGFAEVPPQLFADIHGAVLAAGATNRNGHVAAVTVRKRWNPAFQKPDQIVYHLAAVRLSLEKFDNRLIKSGKLAQTMVPVGIGQAAHIEYIIRVQRHTVLESEGLEK